MPNLAFDASQPAFVRLASITAERTTPVVYWVGAGVSQAAGLPGWSELRARLEKALASRQANDPDPKYAGLIAALRDMPHWLAFQRIREVIPETYRSEIKTSIGVPSIACPVPEVLKAIWELDPWGMLTLNLDRLAGRAFADVHGSKFLSAVVGRSLGTSASIFQNSAKFLINLHGIEEDIGSWVFAKDEIDVLLQDPSYVQPIQALATMCKIVFVGITLDDESVGGLLRQLRLKGVQFGGHFWITHRHDAESAKWANEAGVERIFYPTNDSAGSHSELVGALRLIKRFASKDSEANAVFSTQMATREFSTLPSPQDLALEEPEDIRIYLNLYARELFAGDHAHALAKLSEVRKVYSRAIHNSWFATTSEGENLWFGHHLVEDIGQGEFGRVFKALTPNGELRAIKVLHEVGADDPKGRLGAFRRGVESMKVLSTAGIQGMVRIYDASELPAFAIMDYVDGPNLEKGVESGHLDDLRSKLDVAIQLIEIIKRGHSLPQRVLHRDIRPPNVMLDRFWVDQAIRVVVLDFDLSWHRDALDHSAQVQASHGYLAPEQVRPMQNASTRHVAVDSFGLGMTIYYLFSKRQPFPGESFLPEWEAQVRDRIQLRPTPKFRCLRRRIGRLIARATAKEQSQRQDVAAISLEMRAIHDIVDREFATFATDIVAEEVIARFDREYFWDSDRASAEVVLASGTKVTATGSLQDRTVKVVLEWRDSGLEEKAKLRKRTAEKGSRVKEKLAKAGWSVEKMSCGDGTLYGQLSIGSVRLGDSRLSAIDILIESARLVDSV